jgi:hypothetical protein
VLFDSKHYFFYIMGGCYESCGGVKIFSIASCTLSSPLFHCALPLLITPLKYEA